MKRSDTQAEHKAQSGLSRRAFLAILAGGAVVVMTGCKPERHVPTQQHMSHEAWGDPAEVYATHLELVEPAKEIRVARFYSTTSHSGGVDERRLTVNGYRVDDVSDARAYEVIAEHLLPGQESLAGNGWWTTNVITDAISHDSSVTNEGGDTLHMVGNIYQTYADGEGPDSSNYEPTGPLVFIAAAADPTKTDPTK